MRSPLPDKVTEALNTLALACVEHNLRLERVIVDYKHSSMTFNLATPGGVVEVTRKGL